MHKIKAYIYGCEIYWDGKSYCVHHPKECGHHKAATMDDAFVVAKELGEKYPVPIEEETEIDEPNEEVAE